MARTAVFITALCSLALGVQAEMDSRTWTYLESVYNAVSEDLFARENANEPRLKPGDVSVSLSILADGRVTDLRVTKNTSDEFYAKLVIEAIKHTKIPPPPKELLQEGVFRTGLAFGIAPTKRDLTR